MKGLTKSLLAADENARTTAVLLDRLTAIKSNLKRGAGVLAKIDKGKMSRNMEYQLATIHGWADHMNELAAELIIIQTDFAKRLSQ